MPEKSGAGAVHASRPRSTQLRARRLVGNEAFAAVCFLLPAFTALFLLRILPAAIAVQSSLYHHSFLRGREFFVWLDNYSHLITDSGFRQSLYTTLIFVLVVNPFQIAIAFALALLYNRKKGSTRFWRSLIILPVAAPAAVTGVIWSVIYRPDGLANAVLGVFDIHAQPFTTSSGQALASIIVMLSWGGVGYWMLFLIAGLNDVPAEMYEAASIDGAGPWSQLWRITLPLVQRPLAFVLVADTVANFLIFAPIQILTQGGPNGSTNLLMYDIYSRAYTLNDSGTANAEVVILVAITLVIVAVQFRLLRTDT